VERSQFGIALGDYTVFPQNRGGARGQTAEVVLLCSVLTDRARCMFLLMDRSFLGDARHLVRDRCGRIDLVSMAAHVVVLLLLLQSRAHLSMLLQLRAHRRFLVAGGASANRRWSLIEYLVAHLVGRSGELLCTHLRRIVAVVLGCQRGHLR
jgi:hypothetical protein